MNSGNQYRFEDYLDRANAATSVEALFKVFVDTVRQHGIDRAIFSLATEHDDIGTRAKLGLIHNYPDDWLKYYFEKGFDRLDPVLIHASRTVGIFEGEDPIRLLRGPPPAFRVPGIHPEGSPAGTRRTPRPHAGHRPRGDRKHLTRREYARAAPAGCSFVMLSPVPF
jgi:hypothetical protein